ncbi:hypothetical protein [Sphingomonas soli]|uniref:hypothetical protein n=1 Tax=Sphingomonas soli TaxID=266127 RepID=UPI00082F1632|nr:hypothetical protein [Sphingomonas soli]
MSRFGWAMGLLLLGAAAPVQAMPVREFLQRWERLAALGDMVKLDPPISPHCRPPSRRASSSPQSTPI